MNKGTRIARATFDVVFLLLLLLPILAYLFTCLNEGMVDFSRDFNDFVRDNFGYSTQIGNVIKQVMGYFDSVGDNVPCTYYFSYIVTISICYVFVDILCFVPKLCRKLLKGWV